MNKLDLNDVACVMSEEFRVLKEQFGFRLDESYENNKWQTDKELINEFNEIFYIKNYNLRVSGWLVISGFNNRFRGHKDDFFLILDKFDFKNKISDAAIGINFTKMIKDGEVKLKYKNKLIRSLGILSKAKECNDVCYFRLWEDFGCSNNRKRVIK